MPPILLALPNNSTVCATISQLKKWGCKKIVVISVIGTVEGLAALEKAHPDVTVHLASNTDTLSPEGKVLPGLGDSGDRQYSAPSSEAVAPASPSKRAAPAAPSSAGKKKGKK